ncbi:Ribonuclease HI [Rubrobacter radiotolerans]|uniref:ribonuclease H n=1 Tax=Rubrobacter radiotolerans TaxID=42256 RepID=A0A023X0C2_RUBRA|nr:ribonuclease H [Rubrobacter radiotolerans]AHY45927.1 Ribonuclease HI [Rubrobacter radiotolerans]MDX5893341.1 ribonuclease H [Rubrobacter radiotolerans]SMC03536.1 ribonuclease HI [Rubrobacter radiotolerans DSM 5868]
MSEGITVFTDGASVGGGGGPGGWGVVVVRGGTERSLSGHEPETTNQRMEILAAIKALESVRGFEGEITVYSDSSYLVNCLRRRWYVKWLAEGWTNSKKQPVANRDLWERLLAAISDAERTGASVEFRKVRGHTKATHERARGNRLADSLAVAAKKEAIKRFGAS